MLDLKQVDSRTITQAQTPLTLESILMCEPALIGALFKKLLESTLFPFPALRGPLNAPSKLGVYVIYGPGEKVLHVGSTPKAKNGIAQRLRDHMGSNSSFAKLHLEDGDGSVLRGSHHYRCLVVDNARHRALLEAYAIGHLCPEHIGSGKDAS